MLGFIKNFPTVIKYTLGGNAVVATGDVVVWLISAGVLHKSSRQHSTENDRL